MTTAPPEISVLMTSYNRADLIGSAIESVLASSFSDFELILTDDGSTDGTQDVIRNYAKADDRVKFYQNKTNLGDYPNRNQAASLAQGEWLKYVDSDDYIYPTGLQVLINMMRQFPEAGYGLCSLPQFNERPFPFQLSPREAYLEHYFGRPLFHKAPLSAIIRKSVWERVGGFSPTRMTSDMDMWHRLSVLYPVVLMPPGVIWYRFHAEQETVDSRENEIEYRLKYEEIVKRMLADPDVPLTFNEKTRICERVVRQNRRFAFRKFSQGDFKGGGKLWHHARTFDSIDIQSNHEFDPRVSENGVS
ncbi:glycosyltransferase family A protein [Parasphingorhabdus sp.]|uniref:glycosyltransferase family 2 protein n=1 Tax=Parasphingorhabdus sp. TaxID=2709688 RepID=UPI0032EDB62A